MATEPSCATRTMTVRGFGADGFVVDGSRGTVVSRPTERVGTVTIKMMEQYKEDIDQRRHIDFSLLASGCHALV